MRERRRMARVTQWNRRRSLLFLISFLEEVSLCLFLSLSVSLSLLCFSTSPSLSVCLSVFLFKCLMQNGLGLGLGLGLGFMFGLGLYLLHQDLRPGVELRCPSLLLLFHPQQQPVDRRSMSLVCAALSGDDAGLRLIPRVQRGPRSRQNRD
jgi:hypothetical protein